MSYHLSRPRTLFSALFVVVLCACSLQAFSDKVQAIILAAGKSTRFKSQKSKLLNTIGSKSMILHLVTALEKLHIPTTLVLGHQAAAIQEEVASIPMVSSVIQPEQTGEASAVVCSRPTWQRETILVLYGDTPLLTPALLSKILFKHQDEKAVVTFCSTSTPNPRGYGRVVTADGHVRIVEDRDCTPEQRTITLVNAGVYVMQRSFLEQNIALLDGSDPHHTCQFVDLIGLASEQGLRVVEYPVPFDSVRGVNTLEDLAAAEEIYLNNFPQKPKIIVSMTTIDSRINDIKPVIDSILKQTLKPDSFELYLSDHSTLFEGGIDNGIPPESVPVFLREYERQGALKIKYVDNIGPAKKLLPCLKDNWGTDNIIITIDDDTKYPKDLIEMLYKCYKQEQCMIALHGKSVAFEQGEIVPSYNRWQWIRKRSKNLYHFPIGQAGCLYTPRFFSDMIFNHQTMLQLAPTADDIWFYFMRLMTGTPALILARDWHVKDVNVGDVTKKLRNINCDGDMNDVYLKRMLAFFNSNHIKLFPIM